MAKWRIFFKTDGDDGVISTVTESEASSAGKVREEVLQGRSDVYVPSDRIVCIHQEE